MFLSQIRPKWTYHLQSRLLAVAFLRLHPWGMENLCRCRIAGQGQNPAHQAAINAPVPYNVPATVVSMVCGSGLRSVILGYQSIKCGDASDAFSNIHKGIIDTNSHSFKGPSPGILPIFDNGAPRQMPPALLDGG